MTNLKQPKTGVVPLEDLNNGSVGSTDMRKNRKQAQLVLVIAKEVEASKKEKGFVWVHKGKEHKQVHPDKLKMMFKDGWKRTGCR